MKGKIKAEICKDQFSDERPTFQAVVMSSGGTGEIR